MLPSHINGYTIKHLLGEGGMANVYFAENRIGKKAAIKILKSEFLTQPAIKQRFWQDAEIMAGLKHAGIREVYDFVETNDYIAIIMEYLDGDDLSHYLKQNGAVKEVLAAKWLAALLDAFQYAHDKGIVHRDVKPSNVFLTRTGEVKIIDFGIAKINDGHHEWTRTSMKMGTPAYMSPEQILTPRNVDSRADIYALGVLYYTLLAGKKPYNEDTASDYLIQEAVVKNALPVLGLSSDRANALIAKATQKHVGNRYQSCREMLRDLNANTNNTTPPSSPFSANEVTIIDNANVPPIYATPVPPVPAPQISAPPPAPITTQPPARRTTQNTTPQRRPTPIAVSEPKKSYTWYWIIGAVCLLGLLIYNAIPPIGTPSENPDILANTQGVLTINADKMNVRSAPELNDENILFQLPNGYSVRFLDTKTDESGKIWYNIQYGEQSGWVNGKYATVQNADALVSLAITPAHAQRTIETYHQAVNNKNITVLLALWSDTPTRYHGLNNPSQDDIVNAINVSRCFSTSSEQVSDFIAIKDTNLGVISCYYTLNFMCNPNGSSFDDTKLRTIRTRTDIDSNGKIVYSAPTKQSN